MLEQARKLNNTFLDTMVFLVYITDFFYLHPTLLDPRTRLISDTANLLTLVLERHIHHKVVAGLTLLTLS